MELTEEQQKALENLSDDDIACFLRKTAGYTFGPKPSPALTSLHRAREEAKKKQLDANPDIAFILALQKAMIKEGQRRLLNENPPSPDVPASILNILRESKRQTLMDTNIKS